MCDIAPHIDTYESHVDNGHQLADRMRHCCRRRQLSLNLFFQSGIFGA